MPTIALLLLAVALFFLGRARGEDIEVFQKAAYICLECIGIG